MEFPPHTGTGKFSIFLGSLLSPPASISSGNCGNDSMLLRRNMPQDLHNCAVIESVFLQARTLDVLLESKLGSSLLLEHDLFRKPGPTFQDHALCYQGATEDFDAQ